MRWLAAPAIVLVLVVLVAAASVLMVVAAEERQAVGDFEALTALTASHVLDHVEADQEAGEQLAEELLATEDVSVAVLRPVVVGMGYTIGSVLDGEGRLLVGLPYREEFVGRDFTDLEHVRIPAHERRPAVSQAVVSPAIETPVFAHGIPYSTPYGARVLTLVGSMQGPALEEMLDDLEVVGGIDADLVDREGNLLATTRGELPAEITSFAEVAPATAAAVDGHQSGGFTDEDGVQRLASAAIIGDTGWQLVLHTPRDALVAGVARMGEVAWGSVVALAVIGVGVVGVLARARRRRWQAEEQVRQLNSTLQDRVERRTADVERANAQLQTANAQLEAALEAAREGERASRRLAAVAQGAGEAIIGEDVDGYIISWNDAARRLYGYTAEEAIGQHMTLLSEPGTEDEAAAALAEALATRQVTRVETRRRSRDGFVRWVVISKAPVVDDAGEVTGVVSIHLDVTEREKARAQTQQAEALFESVFRSGAPQAMTAMDGRILDVNDALCEMLGRDREQLLQMSAAQVTHPDDRDLTAAYFTDLQTGRRQYVQQRKRYAHADGHTVHGLLHLTHVPVQDGDDVLVGLVQDITSQALAEQELAEREALLQAVTSSSANITTVYDTTGRCVFAAGAGIAEVGLTPEDLVGSYFVERHGDNPPMMDALRRGLSGEAADVVTEFRGATFDVRFRPVVTDGVLTHVALAATDISEIHDDKQAVEASERRFRALVRHARDAICQLSMDGTIEYVSPGVQTIVGLPPDELVGRNIAELFDDGELAEARRELERVAGPGFETEGQMALRHVDGSRREVRYHITNLVHDPAVNSLAVTLRDVTAQVEAEQAQVRHAAQLEAVNTKLESVNRELASAVEVRDHILDATTHELRTPLTPIVGMLEVLDRQWPTMSDEQRITYFDVIERNAARIATLVEDLLFASRIRGGLIPAVAEPITVAEHVGAAVARWPEMTTVDLHGSPDTMAWCQPDHFAQIIDRLLSNAVTYGEPPYEIDISGDGKVVVISVEDRGPGLPGDLHGRVFEPFVQGTEGDRRTARGLGLGLHIAQTLARANGGDLVHEGLAGSSRFLLTLRPVMPDDPRASQTGQGRPAATTSSR